MKKEINEEFIKQQLENLREGLSAETKLANTNAINSGWLDEIDGPITDVAWELFQTICEVEEDDDLKFSEFTDFISGRKEYNSIDDFIKWFKEA